MADICCVRHVHFLWCHFGTLKNYIPLASVHGSNTTTGAFTISAFLTILFVVSIMCRQVASVNTCASSFRAYAYSHRHADANSGSKVTEFFLTMQINRSKKFSLQAICAFLLSKGDHGFVFSPFYLHMSKICCTFAGAKV